MAKINEISEKVSGLFLAVLVILAAIGLLHSCIDKNTNWLKPDYTQPHEYLRITGYGHDGITMDGNDYKYRGTDLTSYKDNFFDVKTGQCQKHLRKIPEDRVKLSMRAFNYFLSTENDFNDVRVAQAELQCVEFSGVDENCKKDFKKIANEQKDKRLEMLALIESMTKCRIEKNVGDARLVLLN